MDDGEVCVTCFWSGGYLILETDKFMWKTRSLVVDAVLPGRLQHEVFFGTVAVVLVVVQALTLHRQCIARFCTASMNRDFLYLLFDLLDLVLHGRIGV
jgi:hypothetical protein